MKKTTVGNIVLSICLTPFLMQCVAAEKDVRGLDLRTRNINTQLADLERDVAALKNKSVNQAEMGEMIDRLNTEMLQMQGQLDENTHQFRRFQEESAIGREELSQKVDEVDNNLENIQITLAQLADQLNQTTAQLSQATEELAEIKQARIREATERALAAKRAAEEAKRQATKPQKNGPKEIVPEQTKKKVTQPQVAKLQDNEKPAPPAKPASEPSSEKSGDELYDKGLALFKAKKYKEAYHSFSEFIEQNPDGAMAANARFWRGDSLYNQGEYELAILEYQNVIADFSSHPKAPAALLKQGLAFEKLKEPDTAKIVYTKLLEEYPKSEQASAAKERLAAIK